MKRTADVLLVEYDSSSAEEDDSKVSSEIETASTPSQEPIAPAPKKRKLPALSTSFGPAAPIDNPALHQGRTRSVPHVEGQWAAHVYVSIPLAAHEKQNRALRKLVHEAIESAKADVPVLHAIVPPDAKDAELHISLTRPVFLRTHQREEMKRAVKALAKAQKRFTASFSSFSIFENDERTRAFVALDVGAGHVEFHSMCDKLNTSLRAIHQAVFYDDPRFHASIAWALLDCPRKNSPTLNHVENKALQQQPSAASDIDPGSGGFTTQDVLPQAVNDDDNGSFSLIPAIPASLATSLTSKFELRLASPHVGSFDVEKLSIKIGKDVFSWNLAQ